MNPQDPIEREKINSPKKPQKIAIISCIHGNMSALEAVWDDIQQQSVDKVYCLGDLVG